MIDEMTSGMGSAAKKPHEMMERGEERRERTEEEWKTLQESADASRAELAEKTMQLQENIAKIDSLEIQLGIAQVLLKTILSLLSPLSSFSLLSLSDLVKAL